jgi:TfoX/Sxy family transcriptional regulator of competence genes
MASNREYLDFILEQLSGLESITYRAMMGEFILYYRGRIIGGIYDDRLLVKPDFGTSIINENLRKHRFLRHLRC